MRLLLLLVIGDAVGGWLEMVLVVMAADALRYKEGLLDHFF
jgi:hypothetical protein